MVSTTSQRAGVYDNPRSIPIARSRSEPKLTTESKLVLRLGADHAGMQRTRVVVFASVVAAAMVFGGVLGATVLARVNFTPASAFLAAASPSPTFRSNEDPAHENGESAAQEAAENNGTFRPGGPGGPGGPHTGQSNETPAHEAGESASQEAAEKS
jgi:hypothetical protein